MHLPIGPGLLSISQLNVYRRVQGNTRTHAIILENIKKGTQNFVVIFKTLPFDRKRTQKMSRLLMRTS